VSDLLDRVAEPGLDLLRRVDSVLTAAGAPADDPVWPLLRRAGALPGDILAELLGADAAPLFTAGEALRAEAATVSRDADAVPTPAGWRGHAADEFAAQWSAAVSQVDRITERLTGTGLYAAEVAAWVAGSRRQFAIAVAECLASPEAATVRLAGAAHDPAVGAAAAAIAAHVLETVVAAVDAGQLLARRWAGHLDEVRYAPATPVTGAGSPHTIEF
jgi:hypothetical protein